MVGLFRLITLTLKKFQNLLVFCSLIRTFAPDLRFYREPGLRLSIVQVHLALYSLT